MKPDAASGRCVQLRLCPTRLPRGHRKITRSNTKATSDLHSEKDRQIMNSHYNTAKARHIGAESSSVRSSIAKRALQLAKALRRSEITHFRGSPAFGCLVHPMQASSRWDPTRGDLCSRLHARATDFTSRTGYWYRFFYFDLTEGSQGTSPFDLRHHRQTRFGHARSERRRPQFTAHNSLRPLKNGLSLGGSSATRPR